MNWIICSLLTAILWGISYSAIEQIIKTIDKCTYLFISSIIIALFYINAISRKDFNNIYLNKNNVFYWMILSLLSSLIAGYMSIRAIEKSSASLAASLEITYPFWCMLFAYLFFSKCISYTSLLGVISIFVGVIIVIFDNFK